MSFMICCVPGCFVKYGQGIPLHRFPNPVKEEERFRKWFTNCKINEQITMLEIFKNRRVCHNHFEAIYHGSKNRISSIAVPTLHLSDVVSSAACLPSTSYIQISSSIQSEQDVVSSAACLPSTSYIQISSPIQREQDVVSSAACLPSTSYIQISSPIQREQDVVSSAACLPSTSYIQISSPIQREQDVVSSAACLPSTSYIQISSPIQREQDVVSSAACLPSTSNIQISSPIQSEQDVVSSAACLPSTSYIQISSPIQREQDVVIPSDSLPRTSCIQIKGKPKSVITVINKLKKKLRRNKNLTNMYRYRLKMAHKLSKDKMFQSISNRLTETTKLFLRMQITQSGKKPQGKRFTLNEKILALSLYKPSPKAYRILSEICALPKRKTLNSLLQKVNLKPGINNIIFEELKKKVVRLPKHHKYCTLIFDEMTITPNVSYDMKNDSIVGFCDNGYTHSKEFTNHVLVFMLRGVIKKFKQPISYTFCSGSTKTVDLVKQIKDIIKEVQDAGLVVVATVCDQGASNMAAINYLLKENQKDNLRKGREWNGSYFKISNKKIVPILDPPHLMKGIRNNLLTKNLLYTKAGKTCVAKWEHIIDLHKRGPGYRGVKLVPKLTAHHVLPHLIPKMRVKHCTQVFSRSVGTALGFMADVGKLPEESKETADLLLFFDNLFDSINGSSSKIHGGKVYRAAVTPSSPHHKLWQYSLPILKSMKFVDKHGKMSTVPSISNWVRTIEGFRLIINKFKTLGLNSILLRHFNQDPLENFFGAIRAHGIRNTMPNATAFQSGYKTLLINNISSPHSIGANCEKDNSNCLQTLKYFFEKIFPTISKDSHQNILSEHIFIDNVDTEKLIRSSSVIDVERSAALGYCSGWLVKKAKEKIYNQCAQCKLDLESDEIASFHNFIKISEYANKSWLCYPTREAFDFFVQIENITIEVLKTCCMIENISVYIKLIASVNIACFNFLKCEVHKEELSKFLMNKSILFCIHNWCKEINKILSGKQFQFDHNDPIKNNAHIYYTKHINSKRKVNYTHNLHSQ